MDVCVALEVEGLLNLKKRANQRTAGRLCVKHHKLVGLTFLTDGLCSLVEENFVEKVSFLLILSRFYFLVLVYSNYARRCLVKDSNG